MQHNARQSPGCPNKARMKQETLSSILSEYAGFLQAEKGMVSGSLNTYVSAARGLLAVLRHRPESLLVKADWEWRHLDRRAVEMHLNTLALARGWSANTLALQATALRSFFRFLERQGHLDRNPARSLKPTLPPRRLEVPEGEEEAVVRLFAQAPDTLDGARLNLLLELFYGGLLRSSVVYHIRAITPPGTEGAVQVRTPRETLEVPLSPDGMERLHRYLEFCRPLYPERPAKKGRAALPFWIDGNGRACSPARMAREVKQAMEKAGLTGGGTQLRLLAARHFRERGGDIRSLRRLMRAKRLGDLDRYGQTDFKTVARQLRRIHPRQEDRDA